MYKKYNKKSMVLKLFIIIVINIILATGALFIYTKTDDLHTELNNEINNIDSNSLNIKKLRDNLSFVKELTNETEKYDSYLFLSGNELDLIIDLEELAIKNHVSLSIKGFDLNQQIAGMIKMKLIISGKYVDVLEYLTALENYYYFIIINDLEMTSSRYASYDDASSFIANMKLNISIYAH